MKEITFKTITLNWQKIIEGKNEAPKVAAQGTLQEVYWLDAGIKKNLLKNNGHFRAG